MCVLEMEKKIARRIHLFTSTLVCMRTTEQANERVSRTCVYGAQLCFVSSFALYTPHTDDVVVWLCVSVDAADIDIDHVGLAHRYSL